MLEINPAHATLARELFLAGIQQLRDADYRIALDGIGARSHSLTMIVDVKPDLIKLDREVVAGLPRNSGCVAIVDALLRLATRIGAQLVAEGVEHLEQVAALRHYGVGIAQGNLLGPPNRRPVTSLPISGIADFRTPVCAGPLRSQPGIQITDFMHLAVTLPLSATGEKVRTILSNRPTVSGVVLIDGDGKPRCTLNRNRFLPAVSGAYGYALYARREAALPNARAS